MNITAKDIADRLGVSPSTVSRALQGKLVSQGTIDRVREAARELGYRPNVGARIMATGRTGMFGLLIGRAANPYFGRVIEMIQARALRDGYHVAVGCYMGEYEEFERYVDFFVWERRVDGLIVYPMHDPRTMESLAGLKDAGIPIVHAGDTLLPHVHCFGADIEQGWYKMMGHLLGLGHRRIGVMLDVVGEIPGEVEPALDRRYRGMLHAHMERGAPWDRALLRTGDTSLESGYRMARDLLSQPERPSAIFAGNDLLAMGVISAARELGLRIPGDLSLAGYDNTDFASFFDLTTVENLSEEIVCAPLEILRKVLSGECEPGARIVVEAEPGLVIRGSTAPLS